VVGRRSINDALRCLATAKRTQDATLDLDVRTPEAPGSVLDLERLTRADHSDRARHCPDGDRDSLVAGAVTDAADRLRAALAAVLVSAEAPELALVHRWLDNWRGVGLLAVGLHRIGYDLDLRQRGDGHWRATFYVTGIAHSILGGSAWEPTVWRAVQRAGPGGGPARRAQLVTTNPSRRTCS
jgi:hypothetical protein